MPGVFEGSRDLPIGRAIEEILLLAECSLEGNGKAKYAICHCGKGVPRLSMPAVRRPKSMI
jgi:hypothetical protein